MVFRLVLALLAAAVLLCFGLFIASRQPIWRQRGVLLLRWTVMAGLAFFAVLILERVALVL